MFRLHMAEVRGHQRRLPDGLAQSIGKMRLCHPKIKHIAVWHEMLGYSGGLDPKRGTVQRHKPHSAMEETYESKLPDGFFRAVTGLDTGRTYDDFYGFLASAGIDSVKADNQFMPDCLTNAHARSETTYTYQKAWTEAVEKHFRHRGTARMSQTPQNLFGTFLAPSDRPTYLVHNFEDPSYDGPTSHAWHIICNGHNSLLTQHLNVLPDWGMFLTAGPFAKMHAVGRCLSGGPIQITDTPGKHNMALIDMMTARALDGSRVALRTETPGVALEPNVKPHTIFRLFRVGAVHQGASILGLFNFGDRKITELVRFDSWRGFDRNKQYLLRSHFDNRSDGPQSSRDQQPFAKATCNPMRVKLITAFPIHHAGGARFAITGLLGKMTGIAAVRKVDVHAEDGDRVTIRVALKALGIFGK